MHTASSQNQKIADSLVLEYYNNEFIHDSIKLRLLQRITFNHNNPDSIIFYAQQLQKEAERIQNLSYLHAASHNMGTAYRLKGNLEQSIKANFKALEYANQANDTGNVGDSYLALGDIYSISGASSNSILYYNKAISLLRRTNDSVNLASALLNAGDEFIKAEKLDSALIYFRESGEIFNLKNYTAGKAYNLGNTGMVYALLGDTELAESNISEALITLEELGDYAAISEYSMYMSNIYRDKKDYALALKYAKRSLNLANTYGLKREISEANLVLSQLYEDIGNTERSYQFFKEYIIYKDSVKNVELVQEMANLRTQYEVSQKQTEVNLKQNEVDLLNEKQSNQQITIIATLTGLGLILVLAVGLYRRNRFIQKTSSIIKEERNRSDNLLLNILPEETAKELKKKGEVKAKRFDSVSVLFTDFKGFTNHSSNLSPEELVNSVNYYYSKFDQIMEKHGLEKIKTIGDAYMAAGGLPFPSSDHSVQMVEAAFEILNFVEESKKMAADNQARFDIRIGINTGPVVAGVVGIRKFAYDIWGDTVNIASRMESNSKAGMINISESTFQLIKGEYSCKYRGEIEVKNKGKMNMYFVENPHTLNKKAVKEFKRKHRTEKISSSLG